VFPIQEILGERMARVRDPFGHLWLLRQRVEELSFEEAQRRRDALFAAYAAAPLEVTPSVVDDAAAPQPSPGRLHLVIGPVGAGKSTFALRLAAERRGVRFTLDDWMTRLFRSDRPASGVMDWYVERAARCIDVMWSVALATIEAGTDAILEIGLLQRAARERFYGRVDEAGADLRVHLVDAPRELRRRRVEERNRGRGATFSMEVPPEIFELASDLWEPPDAQEQEQRRVLVVPPTE
jgi:predicted kinase